MEVFARPSGFGLLIKFVNKIIAILSLRFVNQYPHFLMRVANHFSPIFRSLSLS